jgi:hypothetical protein
MGVPDVDGENPYAEPRASLETSTEAPAPKTGFTTLQGLAIIVVCALLLFSIYHYRRAARIEDMRARARGIAVPPPAETSH